MDRIVLTDEQILEWYLKLHGYTLHNDDLKGLTDQGTPLGDNVTVLEWVYAEDVPEFEVSYGQPFQAWVWWPLNSPEPIGGRFARNRELVREEVGSTIYARVPARPAFDRPKPPSLEELLCRLGLAEREHKAIDANTIKAEILARFGGEE